MTQYSSFFLVYFIVDKPEHQQTKNKCNFLNNRQLGNKHVGSENNIIYQIEAIWFLRIHINGAIWENKVPCMLVPAP
jgi:hypothetical protein